MILINKYELKPLSLRHKRTCNQERQALQKNISYIPNKCMGTLKLTALWPHKILSFASNLLVKFFISVAQVTITSLLSSLFSFFNSSPTRLRISSPKNNLHNKKVNSFILGLDLKFFCKSRFINVSLLFLLLCLFSQPIFAKEYPIHNRSAKASINKKTDRGKSQIKKKIDKKVNKPEVISAEDQNLALEKANYLFLMDQDTGEVLLEKNADTRISPSSMTKLMTAYVMFDQIEKGKISLNNQCVIGKEAWKKSGSRMFLNYGDVVSIDQLITGLLVVSGNDAATALAEATAGSVDNFSSLMNETGERIGLKNSHFKNPHGLNQEGHYMSLRDLSIVADRIASDFPQYLHYFSETDFTYQNLTQKNRNPLIKKGYEGVTGMKTGYTNEGGYGVVGTATRGDRKLIAITNEAKTPVWRELIVTKLMDYGFDNYKKISLFDKDRTITKAKLWLGKEKEIGLVSNQKISINIPSDQPTKKVIAKVKYKSPIYAPIAKDQEIGTLIIEFDNKKIKEFPLFAKENIDKSDYLNRIYQVIKYQYSQLAKIIKN